MKRTGRKLTAVVSAAVATSLLLATVVAVVALAPGHTEPAVAANPPGPVDLANLTFGATLRWSGLDQPLYVTNAGDGSGRVFIVEQPGRIRVVRNGVLQASPYADIRSKVLAGGERGLLGLAFSPGFATNGRFYVDYTDKSGNTVVARYTVTDPTTDTPTFSAVKTILHVVQPYANHNGGCLQFGPDGYLYVGMGDGGSAGDPGNRAQNRKVLLGKMLRIDPGDRLGTTPYTGTYHIPPSNPFRTNKVGWRKEIWSFGLRNPWRYSFDSDTGSLWIGDVGQNKYEEIDFAVGNKSGQNWGWRVWEGTHRYTKTPVHVSTRGYSFPIYNYAHPKGEAVIGGYVYRGSAYPALVGTYLYADETGWIAGIRRYSAAGKWLKVPQKRVLLRTSETISSFGVDESRELYFCDLVGGRVYQVTGQ